LFSSVLPNLPPVLPDENTGLKWFESLNESLLDIISNLVDDEASVTNYLNSEAGLNIYKKIDRRKQTIVYLLFP